MKLLHHEVWTDNVEVIQHYEVWTHDGELIQVPFQGNEANVLLMKDDDFRNYRSGDQRSFFRWHYTQSPVAIPALSSGKWNVVVEVRFELGQELEVFYSDLGLPHRGIVYQIDWNTVDERWDVWVVHNSKRDGGVGITTLEQFAGGNAIRILRSPESPEHLQTILQRANLALRRGIQWFALQGNCQHFTTWCYTGKPESPTVQGVALIGGIVGLLAFGAIMTDGRNEH